MGNSLKSGRFSGNFAFFGTALRDSPGGLGPHFALAKAEIPETRIDV